MCQKVSEPSMCTLEDNIFFMLWGSGVWVIVSVFSLLPIQLVLIQCNSLAKKSY